MLRCEECGKTSKNGKDWRSLLTIDDEACIYCPDCAEREFGPPKRSTAETLGTE